MNCEHCESLLIDHAHAELGPAEHAEVTRHLAGCPTCALASCRLRADLEGLLQATCEPAPPALRARLRAEVARSFRPSWPRRALAALARPVPAYALLAALALPGLLWIFTRPPHAATTPPRLHGYDAAAPLLLQRPIY